MTKPWEKYATQKQTSGPWSKYSKQEQPRGWGDVLYENVVGRGEVDTTGERIGQTINDMGKAIGSGLVRGVTAAADLPGAFITAAGDLASQGLEAVGVPPTIANEAARSLRFTPLGDGNAAGRAVDLVAPNVRPFEPATTAGEYAQTVGEFLPTSWMGPGGAVGNAVRYGVLPGLASEAAGQATEGTAAEPYARFAAALLTPLLSGRPTSNAAPILPADPEDLKMAETLLRNGVRPTVGQTTGSDFMRRLEGSLDVLPTQADDVTAAAMKTTGSAATRATPEALRSASDDIVKVMNDAVDGVSFVPSGAMAQEADNVVNDYLRSTAQGSIVPDVRNIADEIADAATNPNAAPIALSTLKDWRSRLGRLLQSADPQVRDAAWGLRSIIDDATEAQLAAVGRGEDVARLAAARQQYRNWIAIADAATRAGAENGILSPTQLYQSIVRSQGRRNVAVGNTTELGGLARAAAGVLRPASSVAAGGVRTVSPQIMASLMGAGVANAIFPGSPVVAGLLGAGLGAGATGVAQAAMRSTPVQSLLMDPAMRAAQSMRAVPGAVAGQPN